MTSLFTRCPQPYDSSSPSSTNLTCLISHLKPDIVLISANPRQLHRPTLWHSTNPHFRVSTPPARIIRIPSWPKQPHLSDIVAILPFKTWNSSTGQCSSAKAVVRQKVDSHFIMSQAALQVSNWDISADGNLKVLTPFCLSTKAVIQSKNSSVTTKIPKSKVIEFNKEEWIVK